MNDLEKSWNDIKPAKRKDIIKTIKLLVVFSIFIFSMVIIYYFMMDGVVIEDDWSYIHSNHIKIDNGWLINFTAVHKAWDRDNIGFDLGEVEIMSSTYWGNLTQIYNKFDENGTITFNDVDNNGHFTSFDTIFVQDIRNETIQQQYLDIWTEGYSYRINLD